MPSLPKPLNQKTLQGRFDLFQLVKQNPQRYPFLLESTARGIGEASKSSRYDVLMAYPKLVLRKQADGSIYLDDTRQKKDNFLTSFDKLWQSEKTAVPETNQLPFVGGWFVFLTYELVSEIEPGLDIPQPAGKLPVAMAARIPVAVIVDHEQATTTIIAETDYADAVKAVETDLQVTKHASDRSTHNINFQVNEEDKNIYLRSMQNVHNYIRDGDVFQVNLSRLWAGTTAGSPASGLYENLRQNNPAPFAGYMQLNDCAVLSSSPERLVTVRHNQVETRPIAGTRPRGIDTTSDELLQRELIAHPKERAEHVMLIDLERNDLGRICKPGSVQVNENMTIESYAHVHHIVSNITGQLREGITPVDVIRAVFPGGTITGCPKVRCMEIIGELEKAPRGAYTGSMGYVGHDGSLDLNILIRSIVIEGDTISFRAGAGLVADSVPEKELHETRAKAKGMLMALNGGQAIAE
jgi:anthranilate synthase component 1